MLRLGFGSVEVGTITPRPQRGNPKPRVFRVPERRAVINRLGFNNRGLAEAAERLRRLNRDAARPPGPIGANIGRNKDSADAIADYRMAVLALAGVADWLTVNVSSPNTPGLRALQSREALTGVIGAVQEAREEAGAATPILLKIAPDLTPQDREDIAAVALETGLDGLIVANTTIERPVDLPARYRELPGGLSGRPPVRAVDPAVGRDGPVDRPTGAVDRRRRHRQRRRRLRQDPRRGRPGPALHRAGLRGAGPWSAASRRIWPTS